MKPLVLALACTLTASAQGVLTKSYDNSRTSENRAETILTPATVAAGMVKLPNIPCIGDARGCEAQPLIDGAVMVLASEGNVIRGVSPVDGSAIWQTQQMCVPINSQQGQYGNDMWKTNDHFGMMSTGVIDGDTHKLYQVAFCSADGSGGYPAGVTQRMFVLDTRTGAVLANTLLTGSSNGFNYQDAARKQRSALLLWQHNGVKFVIVMAGSFAETGANATGWLLAYDTYDNRFKAALSTHAGGWMSGQGPAEDMATGLIYFGLGNGPFNATTAFGEATLQVRFTPPTVSTIRTADAGRLENAGTYTIPASFSVLHAWAPFLDTLRTCSAQPKPGVVGQNAMAMGTGCLGGFGDQDAVLSGTLIPERGLYVTAGKDGVGYVLPTAAFPSTAVLDFADPKANCAKARLYEFGWNLGIDPCPANQAALNIGGKTRHQHSPIAQYHSPSGKLYLLFFAENSPLQVWRSNVDGTFTFVARGAEMASAGVESGMPGGFGTVAGNVAWYSIPIGDANKAVTTGYLAAYDLSVLDTIKVGGIIPTLWKSATYSYSKFSQPLIWNGQVYLPNSAGSVNVWKPTL